MNDEIARKVAALERDNGRLEARCGELAAEVALVKEANGCLQERLTAMEAEIQKERHYRQTGTLPPKPDHYPIDFEERR